MRVEQYPIWMFMVYGEWYWVVFQWYSKSTHFIWIQSTKIKKTEILSFVNKSHPVRNSFTSQI